MTNWSGPEGTGVWLGAKGGGPTRREGSGSEEGSSLEGVSPSQGVGGGVPYMTP